MYFGIATQWTFVPRWTLDHLNPLAQSMRQFRFDIPDPPLTYDLINFKGKWYAPWGPLSAFMLAFIQLIKGRYVPTIYLSLFSSSVNAVIVFFLLARVRKEFLPKMKIYDLFVFFIFFLFGTTLVYVGTIGSSWHVDQMATSMFATLGIYFVVKKKRSYIDYLYSASSFALTLIGRPTYSMLLFLPGLLYLFDSKLFNSDWNGKILVIKKGSILFGIPVFIGILFFFSYNYLRFGNVLEYGFRYIHEAPYLEARRYAYGAFSISHLWYNLRYMLFEIPKISFDNPRILEFNLKGNSIFFLSPPFLAIFLASPFLKRKKSIGIDPLTASIWITAIVTMIPSLLVYSTGWMQFGFRYSLDIVVLLLLLTVFGMKGKANSLFVIGTVFSIWIHSVGIRLLQ